MIENMLDTGLMAITTHARDGRRAIKLEGILFLGVQVLPSHYIHVRTV